jgi:TonB family protein
MPRSLVSNKVGIVPFRPVTRWLMIALLSSASLQPIYRAVVASAVVQTSLLDLQTKLKSQHAAIEAEIAAPPRRSDHPSNYDEVLREWQSRLAARFTDAANTVEQIIPLDHANAENWRERLDTLRIYGTPTSKPGQRSVFGRTEVEKRAKVLHAPAAIYTDTARANAVSGDVRLRLILSANGTVMNVFPIKSLPYGLTESAMTAARQIKFQPAIRNGQPVSQFATFVYDFRRRDATPHIPRSVF